MGEKSSIIFGKKGITLIELIIVITIISIFASAVIRAINITEQNKRIRDAERFPEIAIIFQAVEAYYVDNKTYPGVIDVTYTSSDQTTQFWFDIDKYLRAVHKDPINSGSFVYRYRQNETSYELDCMVESQGGLIEAKNDGGNDNNRFELGTDLDIL